MNENILVNLIAQNKNNVCYYQRFSSYFYKPKKNLIVVLPFVG